MHKVKIVNASEPEIFKVFGIGQERHDTISNTIATFLSHSISDSGSVYQPAIIQGICELCDTPEEAALMLFKTGIYLGKKQNPLDSLLKSLIR